MDHSHVNANTAKKGKQCSWKHSSSIKALLTNTLTVATDTLEKTTNKA